MIRTFSRYVIVGVANTAIHCAVFAVAFYALGLGQAIGNFVGFSVSVSFSFFLNAKFTFNARATGIRYLMFVGFMGAVSFIVGLVSDSYHISPWITLVAFASISLVIGFLYSRFFVFKEGA